MTSPLDQAASLLLYRDLWHQPAGQAYLGLLEAQSPWACRDAYGAWFLALAQQRQSWRDYLIDYVLTADNPFSQAAQGCDLADMDPSLIQAARWDLRILAELSEPAAIFQKFQTLTQVAPIAPPLITPARTELHRQWQTLGDWSADLAGLAAHHRRYGTGLLSQCLALRWQAGSLVGIPDPDPIQLRDLVGYEPQRALLLQNTEAFLQGYPALHVLLYGRRGTGKSSLVKALLNAYGDRGLRLIEVAKSDLKDLLRIMAQIQQSPLKFILFVDDLSFDEDEREYKALKVLLEGSLTARPANLLIYATSNRRHLVREFFEDREEVHGGDTAQEKLALSDRFGLTLTFEATDQTLYLQMVQHLARQAQIDLPADELERRALQWVLHHNPRSGRTARQFVDFLQGALAVRYDN